MQLSIDELIRRREVLIVDGKMGTFGSDNCRVMMQFILSMLYGALQRQQQLPEAERVRVAVKVDEAHLIVNPSFADALATLRSAGLEVVAAWQYGAQIEDPKLRGGMMSLLRQRCMFSMGESKDAREMSDIAMSVYVDLIRDDPEARGRLRLTPDVFMNLPNHHALCSWISNGARTPAFLAQTIKMEMNEHQIEQHLAQQHERGCYVPDRLPNPFRAVGEDAERELRALEYIAAPLERDPPIEVGAARSVGSAVRHYEEPVSHPPVRAAEPPNVQLTGVAVESEPPATRRHGNGSSTVTPRPPAQPPSRAPRPDGKPRPSDSETPPRSAKARARPNSGSSRETASPAKRQRQAEPHAPLPESYTELDLDKVRGISWDRAELLPPEERHSPNGKELEILASLWEYRHLFASQIHRRWWATGTLRACQKAMTKMTQAGWVARFRFLTSERGRQQHVYCLTEDGFKVLQANAARIGVELDASAEWREPPSEDPIAVLRDLHVNAWIMALQQLAGRRLRDWRGPARSKLVPRRPNARHEGGGLRPQDVEIPGGRQLRDVPMDRLMSVNPAATVELRLNPGTPVRLDLLIDLDRSRGAAYNDIKLQRYDAFLAGWYHTLDRYRRLDVPPVVVFVCEDVRQALTYMRTADKVVRARLARAGDPADEWPYPSRRQMLWVCERDMHTGSLAALALPDLPPEARVERAGRDAGRLTPKKVEIVARKHLVSEGAK